MKRSETKMPGYRCLGFALIGVMFLWACASTGVGNFYLEPVKGEQASFTHEGLILTSRYLDEDGRVEYLRAKGFEAIPRELRDLPLITFLLRVANESDREAIIDPAGTRFVAGFGPMLSPMSYAHLYMDLPRGSARQKVLKEIQGIAFDRLINLPPGGNVERVLFFRRPEKVGEDVNIVFGSLYLGGVQVGPAALLFKAFPLGE